VCSVFLGRVYCVLGFHLYHVPYLIGRVWVWCLISEITRLQHVPSVVVKTLLIRDHMLTWGTTSHLYLTEVWRRLNYIKSGWFWCCGLGFHHYHVPCLISLVWVVMSHIRDYTPSATTRPICRCGGVADQRPCDDMGHHVPFIYDRGVLHYVVVYHCLYSFRRPIARIGQQVGMPIARINGTPHSFFFKIVHSHVFN
jgi:hypothetical protein